MFFNTKSKFEFSTILMTILIFIGVFIISISVSNAATTKKLIVVSVSSVDTLLDGTPGDFDIKQLTSRLNKALISRLDENGFAINEESSAYKLKIDVYSVAHKLRFLHFKSQYIINYRYKLTDSDQKELLKIKNSQVNEDQIDLIDEVSENIVNKVLETMTAL